MIDTLTYFGPAIVSDLEPKNNKIRITLPGGNRVSARLALATPYTPAPGDDVLALGRDTDELYIIGILKGRGMTCFSVPGDLQLSAPNGGIQLTSARGIAMESEDTVDISSPKISLRAGKLETIADRIVEKARDVYQWISGLVQLKSKRMRTVVDSSYQLHAQRAYLRSDLDINLDGQEINLG